MLTPRLPIPLLLIDQAQQAGVLADVLEESGYQVQLATDFASALYSLQPTPPQLILLDASLTAGDPAACYLQLQAQSLSPLCPVILLIDALEIERLGDKISRLFADYVVKPLRTSEVLGRVQAQLQRGQLHHRAHIAMDAFGQATLAVDIEGRLLWQTPLARQLMLQFFGAHSLFLPEKITTWLQQQMQGMVNGAPLVIHLPPKRLCIHLALQTDELEWLLLLREEVEQDPYQPLVAHFRLTQRQAEVLYWLVQGKTSRDIGDILQTSPRTVNKHLEAVFEKLGVETRTAAATKAQAVLQSRSRAALSPVLVG